MLTDANLLPRYINGGCVSRRDDLVAVAAPWWPRRRNAARVAHAVLERPSFGLPDHVEITPASLPVPPYTGANGAALQLRAYIYRELSRDLVAAIVLGSIATGEEIPYSDFDALAIIRSEVFADPNRLARVAALLDRARAIMIDFDPLQHHGWFVMAEQQLQAYPESYLPVEALRHSRALFPQEGVQLELAAVRDRAGDVAELSRLSTAIADRIRNGRMPQNTFDLKAFLSQFMLLPSLYVQARDGRGVFKKHSFGLARRDFDNEIWSVMDEVSAIRVEWRVDISGMRKQLLRPRGRLQRRLVRKLAPSLNGDLARRLNGTFYERMARLTVRFPAALQDSSCVTRGGHSPERVRES